MQGITECYRVLQNIAEYCRVLQSVTECYRVLQIVTECYKVLQSVTECYRVFLAHLLGPISGLVFTVCVPCFVPRVADNLLCSVVLVVLQVLHAIPEKL